MMRFTRGILFTTVLMSVPALPQQRVVYTPTGQLVISATGTRPLTQMLTYLRGHYGWAVDYEESQFNDYELSSARFGLPLPIIRTVTATVMEPKSGTPSETLTLLRSVAAQTAPSSRTTAVLQTANSRFTVTSKSEGQWLLLDTPITLPSARRTIEATVELICSLAASAHGTRCERGGMADNGLINTSVVLGSNVPIQARQLLVQALDAAPGQRVWILTYDPPEQEFVLGIEP